MKLAFESRSNDNRWEIIKWLDEKHVLAKCICGVQKRVRYYNIHRGASRSCGCLRAEEVSTRRLKHGLTESPEYRSWRHLKERCLNVDDVNFKNYGLRGVSVCEEWLESFETFYKDMGPCPKGMSIDRVDVNGNYEPANCRWADKLTQQNNTTNNVRFEYDGRSQTIAQWAREAGLKYATLYKRIVVVGEDPATAMRAVL